MYTANIWSRISKKDSIIFNERKLSWIMNQLLLKTVQFLDVFLSCSCRRLSICSWDQTEDSTTEDLCQMSIKLGTVAWMWPSRWGNIDSMNLKMFVFCILTNYKIKLHTLQYNFTHYIILFEISILNKYRQNCFLRFSLWAGVFTGLNLVQMYGFCLFFVWQKSGLDMNKLTRHHGLVERVYRDRNRITSPHRKPLSVDKHGRHISFNSNWQIWVLILLLFLKIGRRLRSRHLVFVIELWLQEMEYWMNNVTNINTYRTWMSQNITWDILNREHCD